MSELMAWGARLSYWDKTLRPFADGSRIDGLLKVGEVVTMDSQTEADSLADRFEGRPGAGSNESVPTTRRRSRHDHGIVSGATQMTYAAALQARLVDRSQSSSRTDRISRPMDTLGASRCRSPNGSKHCCFS
jgi:hypothetical protein